MSSMNDTVIPAGRMPTAYGVTIEVMRNTAVTEDADNAFIFSADAAALMAGIHDPAARASFVAAARQHVENAAGFTRLLFEEFGGQQVPRVAIKPARQAVYHDIPGDFGPVSYQGIGVRDVVDVLVTRLTDEHRWCDRVQVYLDFMSVQVPLLASMPPTIAGLAMSMVMSATLEHMGESEIDCLEAAAFYALASHEDWRRAGTEWLTPFAETWVADWIAARPAYRQLARLVWACHRDVPRWLFSEGRVT